MTRLFGTIGLPQHEPSHRTVYIKNIHVGLWPRSCYTVTFKNYFNDQNHIWSQLTDTISNLAENLLEISSSSRATDWSLPWNINGKERGWKSGALETALSPVGQRRAWKSTGYYTIIRADSILQWFLLSPWKWVSPYWWPTWVYPRQKLSSTLKLQWRWLPSFPTL